jgi:AraC-like DNA-binding protein
MTLFGHQVRIRHFHIVQNTAGWQVHPHAHSDYEANIILQGCSIDSTLPDELLKPGMVILHPPRTFHAWKTVDGPMLRVTIGFTVRPLLYPPSKTRWPFMPQLPWSMALLCEEAQGQAPGWQERCSLHAQVMLSQLVMLMKSFDGPSMEVVQETNLMAMVDQFLQENLVKPLTLDLIASQLGVSRRTLTAQFRKLAGESVMRYLQLLRIERAAELLQCTPAPLAEIRMRVGIPDPAYFCKCFHRHFHKSPRQYREEWQSTVATDRDAEADESTDAR